MVVKEKLHPLKIVGSGKNLTLVPVLLVVPIFFKGISTFPPSENLIKYLKEQLDNYIHNILNYKDIKIVEMELFSVNNTCSVKAIY